MSASDRQSGTGGCGTWQADPALLARYGRGELHGPAAWSIEAHLPRCATCQREIGSHLDAERLGRNRRAVLAAVAVGPPGIGERALVRLGVPAHLARLVVVTPSLRRSWLASVTLVLAVALGFSYLAVPLVGARPGPVALGLAAGPAMRLVPFLVLVPLLPLAGVAAAFSRRFDPTHDLAVAAPLSGVQVFFVRSAAVLVASLVPALVLAAGLPGPGWLPAALLLPALAVAAVALAASSVLDPASAAIGVGAAWVVLSGALGVAWGSPAVAFGPGGQVLSGAVLVAAFGVVVARRGRLELGWAR
ncbi:MAG: hypothetical protein M0010_18435 [Actinomycetota bacterium]|nr:hypothetical protein [Actinomycetota bacterium]